MNITIDVCGKKFKTYYNTIVKIPYFKNIFDHLGTHHAKQRIKVNRSSHIFKHVLAIVIDPMYLYPKKYKSELEFYGIDCSGVNFYDEKEEIMKEVKVLLNENKCKYSHVSYSSSGGGFEGMGGRRTSPHYGGYA
jgi:hypothetical protein